MEILWAIKVNLFARARTHKQHNVQTKIVGEKKYLVEIDF